MALPSYFKRIIHSFLYCIYLFLFVILLLEVAYRYQIIDFYQAELRSLNSNDVTVSEEEKTILIFGDSFTVQSGNWAEQLRKDLSDHVIINSSITGTSIIEASYMAPGRIKQFKPDVFIYQIYVGNDLFGIRHALNFTEWSWIRNGYWWMSDYVHVLAYINYKMGQWNWSISKQPLRSSLQPLAEEQFDADHYRAREKIYAQGDPYLVCNSALLKNGREKDFEFLLRELNELLNVVRPECKVFFVVIPHKAQVTSTYRDQMQEIGFRFDGEFLPGAENYPLVEKLTQHFESTSQVKVINPIIPLMYADSVANVYYMNDEHLSPYGQTVVKNIVLRSLLESEKK